MTTFLTTAVLLATLAAQVPAALSNGSLEAALREAISESGAEVGLAFRTLDGGDEVLINADTSFHAASTMKVPVMIELFRRAAAGDLVLYEELPVRNQFRSIVDGSPYQLSVGDDSDAAVYAAAGGTLTLRQLCEAMITVSSNFATNLLIERLDAKTIQHTVERLDADGMRVLRGVEDQKAYDEGLNNTTTARALLVLLESIALGKAVNPARDAEMIDILKRQRFVDAIPAGVPPGTPVAHKTGSITRIQHDAAVVYAPRPYTLVVLVRGIEDSRESKALIAKISRSVYERTQQ